MFKSHIVRNLAVMVALSSVVTATFGTTAPAGATFPGTNGRIAYIHGDYIWSVKPDGSAKRRLAVGREPKWSPNGKRIAFTRFTGEAGSLEVFTMNADGSNVQQVTKDGGASPSWSPDGKRLVFSSGRIPLRHELFIANSTKPFGTGFRVTTSSSNVANYRPDWSPDGKLIAYERWVYEGSKESIAITTVRPDGTRIEAAGIEGCVAHDREHTPRWGPGMRRIAYETSDHTGNLNPLICTEPYGTATGPTINVTGESWDPNEGGEQNYLGSWSPDGLRIVFQRSGDNNGIYTRASNGTGALKLLARGGESPDWGTAP